jgi:lipoprotein signal peptidase
MATARARQGYTRPFSELALGPWLLLPLAVLLGAFLAYQFFHLTPRYVKLLFAISVFLGLVRLPFHAALAVFLVLWTAPTAITVGETNVIFIGVMAVFWIIQRRIGVLPRRERTPLDWAIPVYLGCHLLSFINLGSEFALAGARDTMTFTLAGCLFYLLVVDGLRTESHLKLALNAFCVAAAFVDVSAITDYYLGFRLVPEWFLFAPATTALVEVGGRAQGVFGFHGLLADFSAMSFYLQVILGMRARSRAAKWFFYSLAVLSVHMIALTANRGGAVIWAFGGLYFFWFNRRRTNWVHVVLFSPVAVMLSGALGLFGDRFFYQVRVLDRLAKTRFFRAIPENRVGVWTTVVSHVPEHPWIGHGPFIDLRRGAAGGMFWPHNAYLFYLYTTGILGLLSWLWILGKMIRLSFPVGPVDFRLDSLARVTMAVFHIQIVMFAMSQIRDEHQRGNVYYYYMWILFALATVGWRLARAEKRSRSEKGEPGLRAPSAPAAAGV